MASECLATLKKANLDAVETKIKVAPTIYKGVKRLSGDLTPYGKRWRITGVRYLPTCLGRKLLPYAAIAQL